jgi:hypothetical protein
LWTSRLRSTAVVAWVQIIHESRLQIL